MRVFGRRQRTVSSLLNVFFVRQTAMLHQLQVPVDAAGTRLDVWLEAALSGCSRTLVARCIKDGLCTLSAGKLKPGFRLRGGEAIAIEVPEVSAPEALVPEAMDLNIIHEDEYCVVVNKPPALVVHPAVGHVRGTLLNGLLHYAGDAWVPQLVHRLDEDTSGIITCAKTPQAHTFFKMLFVNGAPLNGIVLWCMASREQMLFPVKITLADTQKIFVNAPV